ncbi:MAG TPA: FtsX-like permease family protein [Vicinamibacterales bacterium]|nr:FtsX-like permease family protein [Vicinamibacterales bacterium]
MTPLQLAWRTTTRYRVRAMLAIAGVTVIGALLFDMLLLSHGLLLSFADLLNSEGFEVRVLAREGFARVPIPDSQTIADAIARLPSVADVAQITLTLAEGRADQKPPRRLTLVGRALSTTRDAATGCEVEINHVLGRALDIGPGSTFRLTPMPSADAATAMPPVDCHVTAFADFGFNASSDATALVSMAEYRRLVAQEHVDAEVILVALKAGSDAAAVTREIGTLRPDVHAYSNEEVVAQFNRNGFAYFRQISGVLSALTTAFAFLLIATLLTVSINQRLGEIAALRALGIARRRIAAMLLWESALLVGAGAVLALPVGGVLAVGLDRILRQMPSLPERLHFFVFEPRALIVHIAVFVVTAAAAAVYPIWLASTLPIASTLRREVI